METERFEEIPDTASGPVRGDLNLCALLGISVVALALASGQWLMVAPFLLALLLHPVLSPRVRLDLGYIGYLTLALPFAILSRVWKIEGAGGVWDFNLFFYLSLFAVSTAIVILYSKPDRERIPRAILCSALALGLCGGDTETSPYLAMVLGYAVCLALVVRAGMKTVSGTPAGRRKSVLWIALSGLAALVLWAGAVTVIRQHFGRLDQLFMRAFQLVQINSSVGFSSVSRLGSISRRKGNPSEELVAIRAYGKYPPYYLRGRSFLRYGNGKWSAVFREDELDVDRGGDRDRSEGRVVIPGRTPPPEFAEPDMTVYPSSEYEAHFFLPLNAAAFDCTSRRVKVSICNTFTTSYSPTSNGYKVYTDPLFVFDAPDPNGRKPGATRDSISPIMKEAGIPPGPLMHDILTKVIARIKRDGLMPEKPNLREKVKGIRSYFEKEYDYHIGIEFETDSPIWEFLTRKKHGHCELFASAGVMLLRKMGVPARYVTGFVCAEPNPYDKTLWVARNKHAHAWVEYFDSDRGWQIAEFTPPSGMPQVGQLEGRDAFWEYLRSLWSRAYSFFRREGIGGLLTLALTFFAAAGNWVLVSWWRIAAAVILFALFFYYRMFAGKRRRKDIKEKPRQFPEDIGQMREAFLRLEKDFRKAGMGRADSETLDEYAARIEVSDLEGKAEAADFVRKYSAARYQPF